MMNRFVVPLYPSSFDLLIIHCADFERTEFALIEGLSAAELDQLTDSRFDLLARRGLEEKSVLGSCFLINCLIRLFPERVSDLVLQLKRFPLSLRMMITPALLPSSPPACTNMRIIRG
jgi:hypothetical protein